MVNNAKLAIPSTMNQKLSEQLRELGVNGNDASIDHSFENASPYMKGLMIVLLIFITLGSISFIICSIVFNIMALDGGLSILLKQPNTSDPQGGNQTQHDCQDNMGYFLIVQGGIWLTLVFFIIAFSIPCEKCMKSERKTKVAACRKFIPIRVEILAFSTIFIWTFYAFGELEKNATVYKECDEDVYQYVLAIMTGLFAMNILFILVLISLCIMGSITVMIKDEETRRRNDLQRARERLTEASMYDSDEESGGISINNNSGLLNAGSSASLDVIQEEQRDPTPALIQMSSTSSSTATNNQEKNNNDTDASNDNNSPNLTETQSSNETEAKNNQESSQVNSEQNDRAALPGSDQQTTPDDDLWLFFDDETEAYSGPLGKERVANLILDGKITKSTLMRRMQESNDITPRKASTMNEFKEFFHSGDENNETSQLATSATSEAESKSKDGIEQHVIV